MYLLCRSQRRRNSEGKPPKPPKMPKVAKVPKPPKEPKPPKQPRERKASREPRPPRDPRLPKQRGRPKKGPASGPSESNTPSPSPMADMNGEGDSGGFIENGYPADKGESGRPNGDHLSTSGPSIASADSPTVLTGPSLPGKAVPGKKLRGLNSGLGKGAGKRQVPETGAAGKAGRRGVAKKAKDVVVNGEERWPEDESLHFQGGSVGSIKFSSPDHQSQRPPSANGSTKSSTYKEPL